MVNYSNGKIYKLECLTTGLIYIGSTTKEYLSQRLVQHRQDYDKYKRGTHNYMTSFKVIEGNNYRIELLETVDCNTKDELYAKEGHYIKTNNCVNKQIMGKTEEDKQEDKQKYYQDNKEIIKQNANARYHNNIEAIKEARNKLCVCECGSKYTFSNKGQHLKTIKHQTFLNQQEVKPVEIKSDVLVWCTCSYNSTACCRNGRCKEEYEKRNNQI